MTRENLIIYLKNVFELEKQLYGIRQTTCSIMENKFVARNVPKPQMYSHKKYAIGFAVSVLIIICFVFMNISSVFVDFFFSGINFFGITELPMAIVFSLIGAVLGLCYAEYSNGKLLEVHNQKIRNAELEAKSKNDILDNVISKIRDIERETESVLYHVYSSDIIHHKYRNIVAIAAIYEYLDTNRCERLEGKGGAYDTYENDSRLSKIEGKLDVVINKLEEIKNSQYMLYEALRGINYGIRDLTDEISKQTEQLNQIAVNTMLTNYRLKVIENNQFYKKNIDNVTLL